jgi:hypothetical protein
MPMKINVQGAWHIGRVPGSRKTGIGWPSHNALWRPASRNREQQWKRQISSLAKFTV